MSKRKFKKGAQVVSTAEIPEHDWFIVLLGRNGKTMHREVLRSWSIRTCEQFIDHGFVFVAQRLTNREFYEGMSDEDQGDARREYVQLLPFARWAQRSPLLRWPARHVRRVAL